VFLAFGGWCVFDLQAWQWIVSVVVAVISVGVMAAAIIRLFSRMAPVRANLRRATRVESGLFEETFPQGARIFDGWAYRMGARFAGRCRVTVYDDRVVVAGPRVPRRLYELWVWVQGVLLALVVPLVVTAAVALDWRWLVTAVVSFVLSYGISFGGAGLWPGLGELFSDEGRLLAVEFGRDQVREVDIGKGWDKGGFGVVLFPYKAGIDRMSAGLAVSFFAPDENGHEVRFALLMYTEECAREFADALSQNRGIDKTERHFGSDRVQ
jgi:hypothetical protein